MSCGNSVILETRDVKRVVSKYGSELTTVDGISYTFRTGSVYNLVGPSGAGKTSYLRLLNRLDEAVSGEIVYRDKSIKEYKPTELRTKIAMLFQEPYLFEGTVRDNLNLCCPDRNIDDIEYHLERVGLKASMVDKNVAGLSVGEKQRVALARALFQQPEVILLDEPTSALDPTSARKIEQLVLKLSEELCLTAIIVTHNPDQAKRLGGETLLLVEGKLVEAGETSKVLNEPATDLGRKYIENDLT